MTSNRKRGAQPGNRNAYKHSFYANNYSRDERRNLNHKPDLESELKASRIIGNRMLKRITSYGLGPNDEGVIDKTTINTSGGGANYFLAMQLALLPQMVSTLSPGHFRG